MKTLCLIVLVGLLWTLTAVSSRADVQIWDAWVYSDARIYTGEYGNYTYYFIRNPDFDVYANPIECRVEYYYTHYPDRFRFTFDGLNLRLNRSHISTVGGSSEYASDIFFAGSWAVCGTVSDNVWTPDPYAVFVEDHIEWAPNTPLNYTTSLLLGYQFEGNGAETYYFHPLWTGQYVQGTLVVRTYAAKMGLEYPDRYDVRSHAFTVTYVPEPPVVTGLLCGIGALAWKRVLSSLCFNSRSHRSRMRNTQHPTPIPQHPSKPTLTLELP